MPATDPLTNRRRPAPSGLLDFDTLLSPDAVPVLGSRDYSRLKALVRFRLRPDDPAGRALADKLAACHVLRPDIIPPSVVVLGARVTFAVEGRARESRILVMPEEHRQDHPQDRWALSVLTLPGMALLGAAAGQWVETMEHDGRRLALHLLMVEQHPAGTVLPDGAPFDGTARGNHPLHADVEHEQRKHA